ncbi:MAG: ribosome small subunit-dependent GTPase A [Gammaproteobacteria bacterium]
MNEISEARVLVAYGGHGVVQTESGERRDCVFRRKVGRPVCGDQVMLRRADAETWVVEAILARKNEFARADERARRQVVAANLDRVLIVVAPRPLPSRDLLDRYLVAVHSLGIEPVIVLNKCELPFSGDEPGVETLQRLGEYERLGYRVLRTSCETGEGVDGLRDLLATGTAILVGQSGVGKSSLARLLLPDLDIQTGALSRVTGKGTHTTTTTVLYRLPGGGALMDSPGVWEFGLWKLDEALIPLGFPEFRPWLGACRFNDCAHLSEPGCAVKGALEAGRIASWRYAAYTRILEQNRRRNGGSAWSKSG